MSLLLGPVMLDLEGAELTQDEKKLLQHPLVGGVILFTRNFVDGAQIQKLVADIRACRSPILIAVDQEGGRVQRFRPGFSSLPPMGKIGELYDKDPQAADDFAIATGKLMASEMVSLGIDISFAPVLDLNHRISEIIGNRAFHSDPVVVTRLAGKFIEGMQQAEMAATGKHFPGHGAVVADSHLAIPEDVRSLTDITNIDMTPFQQLAQQIKAVMPAHIVYSKVDEKPAGFSPFWLQDVLRQQLHFKGVIFSDDLSMEGASGMGDFAARAQQALAAGCTMVLVCNHRQGALQVLESLKTTDFNPQSTHDLLSTLLTHSRLDWRQYEFSAERLALQEKVAAYAQ